jgi:type II secretory pathway pseudopilin PulG
VNSTDSVRDDSGVSMVEVLVAIGLFGLLSSLLLGFGLGTSRVAQDTNQFANVSEDARLVMERLSRELRQANEVTAVQLPTPSSTDATEITIWIDFDGKGDKDQDAADPEILTYRWEPSTRLLTLTANQGGGAVTRPLLSSIVSGFTIDLYSSLWSYDTNGDGRTSWSELDAAPVGNQNGKPDVELARIDVVAISLTVLDGPHKQVYNTQVDLRNRNLN